MPSRVIIASRELSNIILAPLLEDEEMATPRLLG